MKKNKATTKIKIKNDLESDQVNEIADQYFSPHFSELISDLFENSTSVDKIIISVAAPPPNVTRSFVTVLVKKIEEINAAGQITVELSDDLTLGEQKEWESLLIRYSYEGAFKSIKFSPQTVPTLKYLTAKTYGESNKANCFFRLAEAIEQKQLKAAILNDKDIHEGLMASLQNT